MVLNETTVKDLAQTIPSSSPLFLEAGDVLVQKANTTDLVGTTAVFNGPSATHIYPDLMMRLRFGRRSAGEWFWRYANSGNGRAFLRSAAAGSTGTMPKSAAKLLAICPCR
jgi:type I restriction enzyme S subunit